VLIRSECRSKSRDTPAMGETPMLRYAANEFGGGCSSIR
jgi:hypothetical protein